MDSTADLPAQVTTVDRIPVVQTSELRKVYRTGFWLNQKIESLKNCSLTVYQGETFGLLGPNGAGKTTLLKTLLGIVRPTSGRAWLLDSPIGDTQVRQRIGYLPENAYYYDYLTGWEFLQFVAGLFEIPNDLQQQRIPLLIDLVGLSKLAARKKQLRQYSKGMLQRIGLAQALINDPEVVFLDEPMSGLDPIGRYQIREIILSLKAQGKTIFFNSHILSDVEKICDRVAILAEGELICTGSLDELLGIADTYHVKGKGGNLDVVKRWVKELAFDNDCWYGQLQGEPQEFLATLRLIGGQLITMNLARISLEEFFMQQLQQRGITSSH
ncbi:MAG TPA: ABC transporter ATP-binding protein [Candidatus Sericytochromatia bacterium]|jgi:ABC-2 type transport system ATP-binding protein|nr:ABC transporter ATP-binding protein [Cyanobacteriota bacterium]